MMFRGIELESFTSIDPGKRSKSLLTKESNITRRRLSFRALTPDFARAALSAG